MIHLERLTYRYPDTAAPVLDSVSLDIGKGEFVLVAGPSGSGKSTLLRCLNGLVPHFTGGTISGRLSVAGHDPIADGPQVLSTVVGFVFQDPEAQFVVDRVEDEIAFALENAAVPREEMRRRVQTVLELLGLAHLRMRSLDTLSGGQKQRVAIAAALALQPSILVLDEPTSQLDAYSADEVLQALVQLNKELGLTIVLAEHRLERILPYADRLVYVPAPGHAIQSGPPRQMLLQMELTPPVATLAKGLGWSPMPLSLEEAQVYTEGLSLPSGTWAEEPARETPKPLLQVEHVTFAYNGHPALEDVSLSVGKGEMVALMGRNGSGKTTLLRAIVGLIRPSAGKIALHGESVLGRETATICRRVGYLPQDPDDLLFADSVEEELRITLRNHGLAARPPISEAELLGRLGIEDCAQSYPRDLSVGQRQRVALGAVTITAPSLLLLDEPTRGMDYRAKRELARLLKQWQGQGTGVLVVTHDVEFAAQVADRVVVLEDGRVTADGTATAVLEASGTFAPQMCRLFPGTGWLTAEDALRALQHG